MRNDQDKGYASEIEMLLGFLFGRVSYCRGAQGHKMLSKPSRKLQGDGHPLKHNIVNNCFTKAPGSSYTLSKEPNSYQKSQKAFVIICTSHCICN